MQKRRGAARAECRLRAAATERTRQIGAFPLLDENDQNQEDADDDVQNYQNDSHRPLLTRRGGEFFPETAAPFKLPTNDRYSRKSLKT